jgi:YD repeat-containing protein
LKKGFQRFVPDQYHGGADRLLRPDGRTLDLSYDRAGRLTAIRGRDTHGTPEEIRYAYDPAGRLTLAENGTHSRVELTFNRIGQVVGEVQNGIPVTRRVDPGGRLRVRHTVWNGITQFNHPTIEHLETVVLADGRTLRLETDGLDRPLTITFPNGTSQATAYDPLGNILSREVFRNDLPFLERRWTYAADGLVSEATDPPERLGYAYDPAGRLTAVNGPGPLEFFEYDPAGNVTRSALGPSTLEPGNRLTGAGDSLSRNDPCGNRIETVTGAGTASFRYSMLDQLSYAILPDGRRWIYQYDALGRRRLKKDLAENRATRYYWEGLRLLAEEKDGHAVESRSRASFRPSVYAWDAACLPGAAAGPGGPRPG